MPEPIEEIGESAEKLKRRTFHQLLEQRQPEFRYGELLLLLFITFLFIGSAPTGTHWVPFATVVIESATLLVALFASGAKGWTVTLSIVVIALGVTSTSLAWIFNDPHATKAAAAIGAVLVLVGPIVVVRGLARRRSIDLRTVLGALCLYMMAGLFFANVYSAIQTISHQAFFVQTSHAGAPIFLYFSFVTMTTVGYGDFTAAHQFGRTLAAFEAIFGQFYLVTVVAVLVSNMGPAFRYRKAPSGEGADQVNTGEQAATSGPE
jgi:hypothetical protein